MKYFSLFSGIGGFEHGIQNSYDKQTERIQQGWDNIALSNVERFNLPSKPLCIGFSEIDKYATQIYKKHFPEHKEYGDVTKIDWQTVPDFDLLVGGFPCQAFSIAGKRQGFEDTRGTMFFEIAKCLKQKQPRLFLLENVKGLLSHDQGRTFLTILATLDELGYDLQWQVLNSKNFGVPQNRERVFIIGNLRGTSRPEVFPIGEGNVKTIQKGYVQPVSGTLSTKNQSGQAQWDGSTTLIRADRPDTRPEGDKPDSPNSIRRTPYTDGMRIRRLTPTECERLQGFPEIEKYGIIEICKEENVNGVEYSLSIRESDNAVQNDVLIDCVENGVEILSQGKSLLNAKNVEKKNWSHQHIKIDAFVQMLVGINTIVEKIINNGREESHQKEQCLTPLKNGKKLENKYGKEIMQLAESAKTDLTTLKELLKSTILSHLNIGNLEQKLTTLFSFVIPAIIGFIPKEIKNKDTFMIAIKTKVGYTYGVSDTSRYRCLGNAVTTNVIEAIMTKLLPADIIKEVEG